MIKKLSFFLSVLILSSVFGYFIFAWTEPGSSPPGGNVSVPINVGPSTQTKTGGLNLGGNLNLQGNKLIISSGDGEIYRSGGQITYQADDNWYWYSSWDGHNEMTLHYRNGLWLRSDVEADDLKARNRVCIQGDCRSSWPSETNLSGWSFANDYLYDDGEEVIRANDEWLRLNQSGHFTSGVYTPGKIRADGGLYVGDDEYFYRNSEDFIRTGDHFQSDASVRAPIFYDSNNTSYYLNPASTSYLNDVRASIFYDRDNTSYYVNPAGTSKFSTINLGGVSRSSWPSEGISSCSMSCTTGAWSPSASAGSGTKYSSCPSGYTITGVGSEEYQHQDHKQHPKVWADTANNRCAAWTEYSGNNVKCQPICCKVVCN